MIPIDDPADALLEAYRDVRERDLVGRRGLFIAEGEVVLGHWVRNGGAPVSVLMAGKRLEKLRPLLERLPTGTPVYLASQAVMDGVAGFPMHRGILALGARPEPASLARALGGLPEPPLVVALLGVANHDNMGGVFRNAAAFGAGLVLLDETCCDPLYRKSIRVSVGAALTTPWLRAPGPDLLHALRKAGFTLLALTPDAEIGLRQLRRGPKTALFLGAEGEGLPSEVLSSAQPVRIAMKPGIDSLNLAVSCGIALHHLAQLG